MKSKPQDYIKDLSKNFKLQLLKIIIILLKFGIL